MKDVARQYDLEKYIKYGHKVTQAIWAEGTGKWNLTVESEGKLFRDECDIFINAGGILKSVFTSCSCLLSCH